MQTTTRTDDIDNQSVANYSYDLNGRLVSDVHDGITEIKWSISDKVLEVHKPNGVLTIKYNTLDQKVSQSTSRNDSIVTEYFVYDPGGNVLASYGDTIKIQNFNVLSHKFSLHQLTIYGSSRIGLLEADSLLWEDGVSNVVVSNVYSQKLGLKRYELSNHLGNVSTVISDRKLVDSHSNGQITSWKADVISVTDYYPFGMKITERSWNRLVSGVEPYRFGFNGKDFFSDWNRQDYGFRAYDPRKCRFESVDPLYKDFPALTTYQFASNNPIMAIDLDGLEGVPTQSIPLNIPKPPSMSEKLFKVWVKAGAKALIDGPEPGPADVISVIFGLAETAEVLFFGAKLWAPFDIPLDYATTDGLTTTAESGKITLFRGVHKDHPDYQNALMGRASPKGGHSDPSKHNAGDNSSVFTSWTVNPWVANHFATKENTEPGGVVLIKQFNIEEITPSPDRFKQGEVLIKGEVAGAVPIPAVKLE